MSSVAYDQRNGGLDGQRSGLVKSLGRTGVRDVRDDWGPLFRGKVKFRVFTHQAWVRLVRDTLERPARCDGPDGWLAYVVDRYGLDGKETTRA